MAQPAFEWTEAPGEGLPRGLGGGAPAEPRGLGGWGARRGALGGGRQPRSHRRRRRGARGKGGGDRLGSGHIRILYKALEDFTSPTDRTKTHNIDQILTQNKNDENTCSPKRHV